MARQANRFSRSDEESDINLTPMLDVVFIMLIFFIVTATFIKQAGIDVLRPDADTAEQKPTVSVLVAIGPNGDIWIDKKKGGLGGCPGPHRTPAFGEPEGRLGDPVRPRGQVRTIEGGPVGSPRGGPDRGRHIHGGLAC